MIFARAGRVLTEVYKPQTSSTVWTGLSVFLQLISGLNKSRKKSNLSVGLVGNCGRTVVW